MLITKKHLYIIMMIVCIILINVLSLVLILTADFSNEKVIVIDAGHGGRDGGVAVGMVLEADIALQLAFELKQVLEDRDFKVVLTRDSKEALGDNKKADMAARKDIIKKVRPVLVISLHVNKFPDSSVRGVRVFYDDTDKNRREGEAMQAVLNADVNSKYVGRADFKAKGEDFYIVKCTEFPSILIECGFISNVADRALLLNSHYRMALSRSIADSVVHITHDGI